MRVLMLGWEFPPYVSGGLGTACEGLTRALARQGVDVVFALPAGGMPLALQGHLPGAEVKPVPQSQRHGTPPLAQSELPAVPGIEFRTIPGLHGVSPYDRPTPSPSTDTARQRAAEVVATITGDPAQQELSPDPIEPEEGRYEGDLTAEAQRYADWCMQLLKHEDVDVIHAHDWLTFPAGLALAAAMRKPLVVHVHSTEYDRAGEERDPRIVETERRGMMGALTVICVSHLTREVCEQRYGISAGKIQVVHNGIDESAPPPPDAIHKDEQIVLFLGRLTMQKGPEFFLEAAKKVLTKLPAVKFVMAGAGDMADHIYRRAAQLGISDKIVFTGFLRGGDVQRVFAMADVYVMPSVSEPFGIAPLEAIRHDVPVIISRTSGVSEVIQHALKVDFWNTDEIAEKVIAVLRHPPLSRTLREHAEVEVRQLTWDGAAKRCVQIYQRAVAGSGGTVAIL